MAPTDDILASTIILVLSASALLPYVLSLAAINRVRKASKNPFYLLLLALGLSDCLMLALFLLYATTGTLLGRRPLGDSFDTLFAGVLCNVTYFTSLALLIQIALNRYLTICTKSLSKKVHDRRKLELVIGGCATFGVLSAVPQMTECCSLRYYVEEYNFGYDLSLKGNLVYVWYDRSINMITFITLITCYGFVFRKVRMSRNAAHPSTSSTSTGGGSGGHSDHKNQKSDVRLALQSALVAGLMITFGLGFTIIPLVSSSKWWSLMSSVLYIAAIGVHPYVYIGFNKQIRNQAIGVLRCRTIEEAAAGGSGSRAAIEFSRSAVCRGKPGGPVVVVLSSENVHVVAPVS